MLAGLHYNSDVGGHEGALALELEHTQETDMATKTRKLTATEASKNARVALIVKARVIEAKKKGRSPKTRWWTPDLVE